MSESTPSSDPNEESLKAAQLLNALHEAAYLLSDATGAEPEIYEAAWKKAKDARSEVDSLFATLRAQAAMAGELAEAYRSVVGAFAVTLMVVKEYHGETDPEVRYDFAEKHPEIKIARALLARFEATKSTKEAT